ncbi:MAG: nuclease-related domain-containing protein [bacterium]
MANLWKRKSNDMDNYRIILIKFIIQVVVVITFIILQLTLSYTTHFFYLQHTIPTIFIFLMAYLAYNNLKRIYYSKDMLKGRKITETALSQLSKENIILFDIEFRVLYLKSKIDYLIISPYGIFNIAASYMSGIASLDNKLNIIIYTPDKKNIKPMLQSRAKKNQENLLKLFEKFFEKEKIPPIYNLIVLANADKSFSESETEMPILDPKEIVLKIREMQKEKIYTEDECKKIARILLNQDEQFHYKRMG